MSNIFVQENDYSENKRFLGNGINQGYNQNILPYMPSVTKIDDYIYTMSVLNYNKDYAEKFLKKMYTNPAGCSCMKFNDLVGRNYDWNYDNSCEFVIKNPKTANSHASIGICKSNLTKAQVESGEYFDEYRVIPFRMVDGVNDAHVFCCINVVPTDYGVTTGTAPGKPDMILSRVVKHILDTADSAVEGVKNLRKYNLYAPTNLGMEIHIMVSDLNETYIVEFINNNMRVLSDSIPPIGSLDPDALLTVSLPNDLPIMTNFHLSYWNGDIVTGFDSQTEISPEDTTLEPHAQGLERYAKLKYLYEEYGAEDMEGMMDLMKQVNYTKTYSPDSDSSVNPKWFSEFVGDYDGVGDYTIYLPKSQIAPIRSAAISQFNGRTRDIPNTWQTVHTSIYDIRNCQLLLSWQEKEDTELFTL